jgi:hypothetical protein
MMNAYRSHLENAENCTHLAEEAADEPSRRRFERLAEGWLSVAETQDWLDGKVSPARIGVVNHN